MPSDFYPARCLSRKKHPDGCNFYLPDRWGDSASSEAEDPESPLDTVPYLPADDSNQVRGFTRYLAQILMRRLSSITLFRESTVQQSS